MIDGEIIVCYGDIYENIFSLIISFIILCLLINKAIKILKEDNK